MLADGVSAIRSPSIVQARVVLRAISSDINVPFSIDVYADPVASDLPLGVEMGVRKLGVGDGQADGNRGSKPETSVELRSAGAVW